MNSTTNGQTGAAMATGGLSPASVIKSGIDARTDTSAACIAGKRAAMISFSTFPDDPRPHRAATALVSQGMALEMLCIPSARSFRKREVVDGVDVLRIPIKQRRGGLFAYLFQYSSFMLACALVLAWRTLRQRYDVVYVNNMPDVLVFSALVPKLFGAKVILDLHDPMPELMQTIFGVPEGGFKVKLLRFFEKWSMKFADQILTVNQACATIFASRSCAREKVEVVMNSPGEVFKFRPAPDPAPAATNSAEKPFVLMYHGTIVERNGLDLAVQALARVREVLPRVELKVYGGRTDFLDQVMESVGKLGLEDAVQYHGPKRLDEIVAAIETCDMGVIPNQWNPFTDINTPTRIFEYLALGKPVVAPSTRGVQECFGPKTLFFFEAGDADSLAQQIIFAASHPKEVTDVLHRGQQVYLSHTWAQERQTLLNTVGKLVAPRVEVRA